MGTYKQPESADATFYAIVTPKWGSGWKKDEKDRPILEGAKVERITQSRPQSMPKGGGVVVRLTVRIPSPAFLPLSPEAVIEVGMDDLETITVLTEEVSV